MNNDMRISVISYNIWFDTYKQYERLDSLIYILNQYNPSVICLQEVTDKIYPLLIKQLGEQYPYHYPDKIHYYGCVLFSKYEILESYSKLYPDTKMGRGINFITIKKDDTSLTIATSHFESLFDDYNLNLQKIVQYSTAKKLLNMLYDKVNNPIIFCADTNIQKHEESYYFKDDDWNDAYTEFIGDNNTKNTEDNNIYTYDTKTNSNLITRNIKEIRSRIDRIVYRGLKILDYKILKIANDEDKYIEPSDHYGIYTEFDFSNNELEL